MADKSADVRATIRPRWNVPPAKEPSRRSRLPAVAHAILLLLGLAALVLLLLSLSVYLSSLKSREQLRLELVDLELIDDVNPRAHLHFRLSNDSPLAMEVQYCSFRLLLNGTWISSSDSAYHGTDPNLDPLAYRDTFILNDSVGADQEIDLEFTVYIYPAQMDIVRQMQPAGAMSWSAETVFYVLFAYTRDRQVVSLKATWEG